jgi:hypothetical protein
METTAMNKPEILAKFELEDDGKPSFVAGDLLKHYSIQVFLKDAPSDISSVTYKLDPTYHQPIRKVPNVVPAFEESLTSYGDYEVQAALDARHGATMLKTSLSEALEKYYKDHEFAPEIAKAIEDIRRH